MKAISLWQPWASFVANGAKKIETRGWPTKWRGPIAIHAAKRWTVENRMAVIHLNGFVPEAMQLNARLAGDVPRGGVVALAVLLRCEEMTESLIAQQADREIEMGDWQPGRFAWILENVRPLKELYPMTGRQSLWTPTQQEAESIRLLAGE